MRFIWAASILAGGLLGGCLADGQVGYRANYQVGYVAPAPAVYVAPPMVEIEPGIQVISDYDQPVFYSDNLYWRYDGGTWYSSRWHDRGWATSYNVPERVRRVDRPQSYVHYRGRTEYNPGGGAVVRDHREEPYRGGPAVRDHREEGYREPPRNEPVVRDHREPEPYRGGQPVVRDHRDAPPPPQGGPVVRDHRDAPPPPPAKKPVDRDHR